MCKGFCQFVHRRFGLQGPDQCPGAGAASRGRRKTGSEADRPGTPPGGRGTARSPARRTAASGRIRRTPASEIRKLPAGSDQQPSVPHRERPEPGTVTTHPSPVALALLPGVGPPSGLRRPRREDVKGGYQEEVGRRVNRTGPRRDRTPACAVSSSRHCWSRNAHRRNCTHPRRALRRRAGPR